MRPLILFLVGPTAAGKSAVAAELARRLKTEIISCDSMQIYKGMEIITCKPPRTLRKRIRHHLIGIIGPAEEYDVSRYRKEAVRKLKRLLKKGKIPLFAGGTGLYLSVLLDGIFREKKGNKNIRRRLYNQLKSEGAAVLYQRLKRIDPAAAGKIHPHDLRRIIRALEVFAATGRPISRLQRERKGLGSEYRIKIFCLNPRRDILYKRIERRVEEMFEHGLLSEARQLLKGRLSRTAACAIGIQELRGYFGGLYSLEQAKELIKRNTRRYAKRQLTWFRKDKRISWINTSARENPRTTAARIIRQIY